ATTTLWRSSGRTSCAAGSGTSARRPGASSRATRASYDSPSNASRPDVVPPSHDPTVISTELSRKHRYFLLATTIVPPLGVLAAIALLWNRFVGWSDMVVLVTMYILCGLGISAGFHRLFSHHSYRPVRPFKIALAAFGTMAAHGPPLLWVAHHRRHHAHADHEGDPHS